MSALPEKGDARRAMDMLKERATRVCGEAAPSFDVGDLSVDTAAGTLEGEGAPSPKMIFGDLVDLGSFMGEGGANLVSASMGSILMGRNDLGSALASLLVQGVGIGVLMERTWWERRDAA